MSTTGQKQQTGWTGWVVFAGILMVLSGALWAIQGLIALFNDDLVIFGKEGALLLDITGWGWVHLILGLLLALSGVLVMRGNLFGRTIAVILVMLSIIVNFVWLPVYPVWAIVVIAIDVFVLYAVIVHGKELKS